MIRSVYTQISNDIGFDGKVNIPTNEKANELFEKVLQEDENAFREVFKIHRFSPSPEYIDTEGQKAMNTIYQAFLEGSAIFKNKFVQIV